MTNMGSATSFNLSLASLLLLLTIFVTFSSLFSIKFRISALVAAISGLILQSFHSFEHIIQLKYWSGHRDAPGFMSPIAKNAATGLETIAHHLGFAGSPSLGMELLHLTGNIIFFFGVLSILISVSSNTVQRSRAQIAVIFEGIHLIEHMLLSFLVINGRPAWGASTFFGSLSGSQLSTYRIWWHAIMNIAGLALFAWAYLGGREKSSKYNCAGTAFSAAGILLFTTFFPFIFAFSSISSGGYLSADYLLSVGGMLKIVLSPIVLTALLLIFIGINRLRERVPTNG
jgi:hypothetical protein